MIPANFIFHIAERNFRLELIPEDTHTLNSLIDEGDCNIGRKWKVSDYYGNEEIIFQFFGSYKGNNNIKFSKNIFIPCNSSAKNFTMDIAVKFAISILDETYNN